MSIEAISEPIPESAPARKVTGVSCAYMRLDTELAKDCAYESIVCGDPTRTNDSCLANWQQGKCPCKGEIIIHWSGDGSKECQECENDFCDEEDCPKEAKR